MRISVWSSDVCSSDLQLAGGAIGDQLDQATRVAGRERARDILEREDRDSCFISRRNGLRFGEPDTGNLRIAEHHCGHGRIVVTQIVAVEGVFRSDLSAIGRHVNKLVARSDEHTSELQSLMRISYAVFCLKTKINSSP